MIPEELDKTINQMVDDFLASPKWSSGIAKDNIKFVTISGKMSYGGKPVTEDMQFVLLGEDSFKFYTLEIDNIPQNQLMAAAMFSKMCRS